MSYPPQQGMPDPNQPYGHGMPDPNQPYGHGMPGDPNQQQYSQPSDPYSAPPDPYAQQAQFGMPPGSPPGGPPPTGPIQLGPGTPTPPQQPKTPWIVAGITTLIAVGSLVAAVIMVTGDESENAAKDDPDPKETKEQTEAQYHLTKEVCGDLDESSWDSVVKVDDLEGYPSELYQMRCSASGDDIKDGMLRIEIGTAPDSSEAEDSYEQFKGDMYDTSGLEEVDGDWDQAEVVSEKYGGTVMLVQDANLYFSVKMTVDKGDADELEEAASTVAKDIIKQVESG